ncbi:MAG: ABC transporter ATP-binding protein [Chloroflexota bacterium]|nr:ABC transporter ATP-binding protein [Chloroflexota bacterium]
MTLALEMRSITKRFPGVLANDHVNFQLKRGEIHALLGENGAGKSTLMNILYGLYSQDEGQIFLNGREVSISESTDAIKLGIGMVHQHFMLVPVMTVAENIVLGTEIVKNGFVLDLDTAAQRIRDLSRQYGLEVDPDAYIKDLPVGTQQRVEIIKALYREADVLILDEPTAVLTPQEAEELFVIMRSLVERGKSIIFITHKLGEVFAVADRITVLRNGHVVGITTPAEATKESLAEMMVGREVILTVDKGIAQPGPSVLQVENLIALDDREALIVDGVSLQVQAGEILGIAGVQGNGQTELVEVLTGLRRCLDGRVVIGGVDVTNASPRKITDLGVSLEGSAHIPEDRHEHGMVYGYSIADNLILNTYYKSPFAHGVVMDHRAVEDHALRVVHEFDIRTPSVYTPGSSLSGGNQQKVVVGRELSRPIQLLIAAQPTRGLDVGSIEFIHNRLVAARDDGVAVLLVSAELDEIMSLSDRITVMYKGQIIATLDANQASREEIGLLMAGIVGEEDHAAE